MADTVNQTSNAAGRWQKDIVWIRANVGYMLAEVPFARSRGHDVSDIEALLSDFDRVFTAFSRDELEVFTLARAVESDDSADSLKGLVSALRKLKQSFRPWLTELHSLVEARQQGEHDLPYVLLTSCGAEMLNAHTRFVDAVEAHASSIEKAAGA